MIVTKELLESHHACKHGVRAFLNVFPSGSADTQNAEDRKKAIDNLLDQADWLVDKFVPHAAIRPHREAYHAAVQPHREAYHAAVQPHREAYDVARQTLLEAYQAARQPLLEAYAAAERPHKETYLDSCLKEI